RPGKLTRRRQPRKPVRVGDAVGAASPAPGRDPLVPALRTGGVDLTLDGEVAADRPASIVIALFGDIRAWKGRPGYSAAAKETVRRTIEGAGTKGRLIVQFGHPRLADELQKDAPSLCAWGGEP